jgi:hypothetical protein
MSLHTLTVSISLKIHLKMSMHKFLNTMHWIKEVTKHETLQHEKYVLTLKTPFAQDSCIVLTKNYLNPCYLSWIHISFSPKFNLHKITLVLN